MEPFNLYVISVTIAFVIFALWYLRRPEQLSEMFNVDCRFRTDETIFISFAMSFFWIFVVILYLIKNFHEKNMDL